MDKIKKFLKSKTGIITVAVLVLLVIVGSIGGKDDTARNNDAVTNTPESKLESSLKEPEVSSGGNVTGETDPEPYDTSNIQPVTETPSFEYASVPAYTGSPYTEVNGNVPYFGANEYSTKSFEKYGSLDYLGRCTIAYACLGRDIMPTEDRGSIGQVKPSGWQTVKYDNIDGKYLYNRCHLIGFQLSGENANTSNLITGTRYLNVTGMLPFENMTADYIKETGNHVMYRVTPVFVGNELVARGVLMEAYSVEDKGDGVCFNVFCYNVQPDIQIDYADGSSQYTPSNGTEVQSPTVTSAPPQQTPVTQAPTIQNQQTAAYILNTNTKIFHYPSCSYVKKMKESNKKSFSGIRSEVIAQGYKPCGHCHP